MAASHKQELRARLEGIADRLGARRPNDLAAQLVLLVNGAFVSSQVIAADEGVPILLAASHALVAAAREVR